MAQRPVFHVWGRFQLWVSVAEVPGNRAEFVLPFRRYPNHLAKSIEQSEEDRL